MTSGPVVATGIWNLGFKFALPIVAVILVAATGHSTGGAVGISLLGVGPGGTRRAGFPDQSAGVIRERGRLLTAAVLVSQFRVFFLVLFCVRAACISAGKVSFLPVLLSFAVAGLAGALPITPGGLGSVNASFSGMLIAFGATSNHTLAADLVWQATTYFPPIVLGIVTYVLWRRGLDKGTYQEVLGVKLSAGPRH